MLHLDCREVHHLLTIIIAVLELQRFGRLVVGADAACANVAVPYETPGGSLFGSGGWFVGGSIRSIADGLLDLLLVLDEILGVEKWHGREVGGG